MTKEKDVANAADRVLGGGEIIRLVDTAFAYCFNESNFEHKKYVGQTSTIMIALTSKDGYILFHFAKFDESQTQIQNTSFEHLFYKNHDLAANKGRIKGHLRLERIFGICKTFKEITKELGFHLTFKTADLLDIIYKALCDNIKVSFDKLFLYVWIFIPDAQTEIMFSDSIKNSFTVSFDSWSTDRKTVDTQIEYQVHIGSAQKFNNPKYLLLAHQTAARTAVPNKANKIAVFDNLNDRKRHVDIDNVRYPTDGYSIDYA